jgi:hypothetical protein
MVIVVVINPGTIVVVICPRVMAVVDGCTASSTTATGQRDKQ